MKIRLNLEDGTCDTLAMMMIGYVMGMPKDAENYQKKVEVVVEFLEEVIDPSFDSVACYLTVLELLPATVKRRMPYRVYEFVNMYERQIEEALGREIPGLYKPRKIHVEPKVILGADGSVVTKIDNFEVGQKFEGTIEGASANPPKLDLVL